VGAVGGWRSVVVLEANSRLGGRAHATHDGIDLGGSWVWASNFPSTRKLVKELGMHLVRRKPPSTEASTNSKLN
jgi:monoamine oxidase